jgi:uncharacterized BrkB/YihY/UPF0761 family membrane protein
VNPFERAVRRIDAAQQRFGPAALVFGVMKKFGDDNAGVLVTNFAYSAFICVFPLLLMFITLLSIVLVGHPAEQKSLFNSALGQFPVIGSQLAHNIRGLHRSSVVGLVVGVLGLLWGSTGLAQAGLFSMAQVWNLSGPERPNYITRMGRSLLFLVVYETGTEEMPFDGTRLRDDCAAVQAALPNLSPSKRKVELVHPVGTPYLTMRSPRSPLNSP